jgi:hypothetical protein
MIGFIARATIELVQRRPAIRLAYNSAVYALAGGAAGGAAVLIGADSGIGGLFVEVLAVAFYAVNILLTAGIIARWSGEPFLPLLKHSIYWTVVPFSIMASVSLMLAVLWERSPFLATALVGPLVAIALYQRSVHSALKAMRLALTDPLTGLGNHRHFHERLHTTWTRPGRRIRHARPARHRQLQINDRYAPDRGQGLGAGGGPLASRWRGLPPGATFASSAPGRARRPFSRVDHRAHRDGGRGRRGAEHVRRRRHAPAARCRAQRARASPTAPLPE